MVEIERFQCKFIVFFTLFVCCWAQWLVVFLKVSIKRLIDQKMIRLKLKNVFLENIIARWVVGAKWKCAEDSPHLRILMKVVIPGQ